MKQPKLLLISLAGLLIIVLVWIFSSVVSGKSNYKVEEVNLGAPVKDVSIDAVREQEEKNLNKVQNNTEHENLSTEENDSAVQRLQRLIEMNSNQNESDTKTNKEHKVQQPIYPTKNVIDSITNSILAKPQTKKKKKSTKKLVAAVVEEKKPERRGFNTVSLHKNTQRNAIKAFVHSDQTVMLGATLKMRLGEDCFTDNGQLVKKGSAVYGEVKKIDGERIIVVISTVKVNGNIFPFKKDVYSTDALEGIYAPGNIKTEINKDASAGAVDGANLNVMGGMGLGSQLAAGATNGVVNATKQATSKNIKKIKILVKTNYALYLMESKDKAETEEEE